MEKGLLDVLLGNTTTHTFSFENNTIELRTLTQDEKDEVVSRVFAINNLAQEELLKRPILGYAIQKINGVKALAYPDVAKVSEDNKHLKVNLIVEKYLGTVNSNLVDVLFTMYIKLEEIEVKRYEEIKKHLADHSQG